MILVGNIRGNVGGMEREERAELEPNTLYKYSNIK